MAAVCDIAAEAASRSVRPMLALKSAPAMRRVSAADSSKLFYMSMSLMDDALCGVGA